MFCRINLYNYRKGNTHKRRGDKGRKIAKTYIYTFPHLPYYLPEILLLFAQVPEKQYLCRRKGILYQ